MTLNELLKQSKACIFDMDGTLVDSLGIWSDIDKRFFAEMGKEVPPDYDKIISHMSFMEMAQYTKDTYAVKESVEEIAKKWLDWSKEAYLYTIQAKKGASEFLSYLKNKGFSLSLATTNKEELYLPCLKRNKLDIFFDHIENVNSLSTTKKEPKIYLHLASLMNSSPDQTLVFEDILMAVKTAKAASFKVISVYDKRNEKDLKEIKKNSDFFLCDYSSALSDLLPKKSS